MDQEVAVIAQDHHVRQDQAAVPMTEEAIAAEIEAVIVEASLHASQITAAMAAAGRTLARATGPVDQTVRATMTTSVVTSPATHHLASLAASDRMRMQGIDKC